MQKITPIRNSMRQENVKFEGFSNVMCKVCGQTFSNFQEALDHAWSIDNPAGMDVKDFNYCAHQKFETVQYYETVVYPDTKPYEMNEFGRRNDFDRYDKVHNADGQVVDDKWITMSDGFKLNSMNGKLKDLAKLHSKVPLVQSEAN